MLGYALPVGDGKRVLWYPAPRFSWGELKGLGDEITILSPDANLDVKNIPMLTHDNVYRVSTRTEMATRWFGIGRMMLWGLIWLMGMDRPMEDIVGGLYLLLGLPFFYRLLISAYNSHLGDVLGRFRSLFYSPRVNVVFSPRLRTLETIIELDGIRDALHKLDELGLGHLREFYRRATWQERWKLSKPTGAGVI